MASHLHHPIGVFVSSSVGAFAELGVCDWMVGQKSFTVEKLCGDHKLRESYVRLILQALQKLALLSVDGPTQAAVFTVTEAGEEILAKGAAPCQAVMKQGLTALDLINGKFDEAAIQEWCKQSAALYGADVAAFSDETKEFIQKLLNSLMVENFSFYIGIKSFEDKDADLETTINKDEVKGSVLQHYLQEYKRLGLLAVSADGVWSLTETGNSIFVENAGWAQMMLSVSYLPLLCNMVENLKQGGKKMLMCRDKDGNEVHISRRVNIIANERMNIHIYDTCDSYLKNIVNKLFTEPPLEEQPKFMADMGCGNANLMIHLHKMICEHTERGKNLDKYPLILIGADFFKEARTEADAMLKAYGKPYRVMHGDINDPDLFAEDLKKMGFDIQDGLHTRSFLDHNRSVKCEKQAPSAEKMVPYMTTGTDTVEHELVISTLIEHFSKWHTHTSKFGLLPLEAHLMDTVDEYGSFDMFHFASAQYPVTHTDWVNCAKAAGYSVEEAKHGSNCSWNWFRG